MDENQVKACFLVDRDGVWSWDYWFAHPGRAISPDILELIPNCDGATWQIRIEAAIQQVLQWLWWVG